MRSFRIVVALAVLASLFEVGGASALGQDVVRDGLCAPRTDGVVFARREDPASSAIASRARLGAYPLLRLAIGDGSAPPTRRQLVRRPEPVFPPLFHRKRPLPRAADGDSAPPH